MSTKNTGSDLKNTNVYRTIISVIMGLIGFIGIFYATRYDFNGFSINFAWSIILPLLVTLAWGKKYGLISITFGLTVVYPFILGSYNGWASLVPTISLYLWIIIHGYGAEKRQKEQKIYFNIYFLQCFYILIRMLIYATLFPLLIRFNPPFWNPEAFTHVDFEIILLFSVKGIIVESILLALGDALMLLPFVRKFFKLEISNGSMYNTKIMAALVAFGLVFTMSVSAIHNVIIDQTNSFQWLFSPDEKTRITFLLATILFFIMGGVTVRFVQQMLETQAALRIREKEYQNAIIEIERINNELEKRVEERTSDLQNAMLELEKFSYTISHDLKSPLRAIDGYGQFIIEDYKDCLDREAMDMVDNIRHICKDMIGLIEKLLEYSITSKAQLSKERTDIELMISDVFHEFEMGTPDRQMTLSFQSKLPIVYVDKVFFKQMLTNIISNAVKFTKYKATTEITVGYSQTKEEYLFFIKDNGVGFDMKYSGKLFNIFQRLHKSQEFEGTGIGLATIRKVVQKHHGKVWIESVLNEGTTIYFTIPIRENTENEGL